MNGLKLIATGRALPENILTNDDMARYVETSDEWISTRTGIKTRCFCGENESAATLAVEAAKKALESANLTAQDIDVMVLATSSGETVMPSTACTVHGALGMRENIPVMDVGAACAGFLYALEVARSLMIAGSGTRAMVIGTEKMSGVLDMADRNTCVLFGDGAGAAIFELDAQGEYVSDFGTRAGMQIIVGGPRREQPMTMEGQDVFRFATRIIPECAGRLLEKAGLTVDAVDHIVCHQANQRILDASMRRLGIGPEKMFKNLDRYANTSAASIPIALDEMRETGVLASGQRVILCGFGGGLTWGGVLMTV